ncbi:MAG TPA: hypothetical protein DEF05_13060, partial [Erwinia sp.]|nr:hypothetical protein [Erwinia sp.]
QNGTQPNVPANDINKAAQPARKWDTVKPVKPIVGGPGSASRPDGNNHAGSAKPAQGSPKQNGTQPNMPANDINKAVQPAKKWEPVKPVRPIVGGPGSSTSPGSNNSAGSAKPANGSPAQDAHYNKNAANSQPENAAAGKNGKSDKTSR